MHHHSHTYTDRKSRRCRCWFSPQHNKPKCKQCGRSEQVHLNKLYKHLVKNIEFLAPKIDTCGISRQHKCVLHVQHVLDTCPQTFIVASWSACEHNGLEEVAAFDARNSLFFTECLYGLLRCICCNLPHCFDFSLLCWGENRHQHQHDFQCVCVCASVWGCLFVSVLWKGMMVHLCA